MTVPVSPAPPASALLKAVAPTKAAPGLHEPTTPVTRFSIVIPAYNEELYLGPCLQSLASQDFPGPVEVIVVDNNSTDRTDARRRIGRCEGGGRGSARRWYYLLGYWTNRLLHRQVLGLAPALGLTELPVERRPWRRAAIGTIAVLASFLMIGWVEFRVHRT